jgi:hypothetical protein
MNKNIKQLFLDYFLEFLFEYKKINFLLKLSAHLLTYSPIISLLKLIKKEAENKKVNLKYSDNILAAYAQMKAIEEELINLHIPNNLKNKFHKEKIYLLSSAGISEALSRIWEPNIQYFIIEIIPEKTINNIIKFDIEREEKIKIIAEIASFKKKTTTDFINPFEEKKESEELKNFLIKKAANTQLKNSVDKLLELALIIEKNCSKINLLKKKTIDFIDLWSDEFYSELDKYVDIKYIYNDEKTTREATIFLIEKIIEKNNLDNNPQKNDNQMIIKKENFENNITNYSLFMTEYNKLKLENNK